MYVTLTTKGFQKLNPVLKGSTPKLQWIWKFFNVTHCTPSEAKELADRLDFSMADCMAIKFSQDSYLGKLSRSGWEELERRGIIVKIPESFIDSLKEVVHTGSTIQKTEGSMA